MRARHYGKGRAARPRRCGIHAQPLRWHPARRGAALARGGSINGAVTAEDTGAPLADVCVDVVDTSFNFFGSGFTDASGNYSVAGLPSGDYTVGFFDCGFPATHLSGVYDDQPDFAAADLVAVTQGVKTGGIDAELAVAGVSTVP